MTAQDLSAEETDARDEDASDQSARDEEDDYGLTLGWDSADKQLATASVARMSARLPGLLRETFALGWRVDRGAVTALLVCQAGAGTVQAFGLLATTTTIGALIASGQIGDRLHAALPSLIVLGVAAVVRAVLGVAVVGLSRRVAPRIGAEAELMLLRAVSGTELVAYEHAGFNDRVDAAERGANGQRAAWLTAKVALLGAAVAGAASFLVWAGLVYLLASGRMSVAHAGAAVVSLQVVSDALWGMVAAATRLFRTSLYLSDWRAFLEEAGGHSLRRGTAVPRTPEVVRAERVTYTYPGARHPSLRAVDFQCRSQVDVSKITSLP